MPVALRKESVDRNSKSALKRGGYALSLSARRAWIEIWAWGLHGTGAGVALRKESVDRNGDDTRVNLALGASLSARRAWIEIILVASITT